MTTTPELNLKQKLNLETAKIGWKELELFFAKGVLLCVAASEDLITVAEQIASNQQDEIEALITEKKIEFVTPEWARGNCQSATELWAVVVTPYVLCQLAG